MAESKKDTSGGLLKWGLIIGGIIFLIFAILAFVFVFFLPSFVPGEEGQLLEVDIPEVIIRIIIVFGIFIVGIIMLAGLAYAIWALFFKKKELHIVKEHAKIVRQAAQLNPVETLGNIVMTGQGKIQHYSIGKITGHTQVPVKFERHVVFKDDDQEDTDKSESVAKFNARVKLAVSDKRDRYDFFSFITQKGVYALPIMSLLEPVQIFACYPSERSSDLVGDVEIYDIGTWKYYSIIVPAQRASEPLTTLTDLKNQLLPIAITSLMDYIGLVAQRGIEGDTSMQKWIESKASLVNIKQET